MAILSTAVMVGVIIWVIAQLLTTRRRVRQGEIVVPPLFAATLIFILFTRFWTVPSSQAELAIDWAQQIQCRTPDMRFLTD